MGMSKWIKAWKLRNSIKKKMKHCKEELNADKCKGVWCRDCKWGFTEEEKYFVYGQFER